MEVADRTGKEITSEMIWSLFQDTYLGRHGIKLVDYSLLPERGPARGASPPRSRWTAPMS